MINREALTSAEIVRILEASGYLLDLNESGRAGKLDQLLVGRLSSLHADVLAEKEDRERLEAERKREEAERKRVAAQGTDPEAEPGSSPEEPGTEPQEAELVTRR